jgi:uncharacterized ion transporter superfamily protein YfcC
MKKIPHTYVIVFSLILLAALSTWLVPGGSYERKTIEVNGIERTVIVDHSFQYTEGNPQSWQVFSAFFNGFEKQAGIIVFILMIGGAFWIMNQSRAIDVGILSFLRFTQRLQNCALCRKIGINNIVMILIMLLFSVFGAVFGMSEETIAFIAIVVPLAIRMGYDSLTGTALVFVAAGLGFAGAVLNPFTIGIAQGLSDLPLFSGMGYRIFSWFVINTIGFIFILNYASKVKRNPESSPTYHIDEYWRQKAKETEGESIAYFRNKSSVILYVILLLLISFLAYQYPVSHFKVGNSSHPFYAFPLAAVLFAIMGGLSLRKSVHFFVLTLLFFTIYFLIVGVMSYGWYIGEIAALFLAMGILSGISMNYGANLLVKHFIDGVKDIVSAALVVGLAGGIIIVLQEGKVIDTLLHAMAEGMQGLGKLGTVEMMYVIQNGINIIIPSGSAKAALTMPLMAPFSDVVGLSRQATVMAFQLGDGFTNMITPTSGVLLGVLAVARIPYELWFKWIWKLMLLLILLGALLLIPTVLMPLVGF